MERHFQLNWKSLVAEAIRRRKGLNLTQKQLATLASVSTPTISRFEQNQQDIQLSTVLAILAVLGMLDQRELLFTDKEWQRDLDDSIVFWGQDGERRVRCRISREALEDHFSERDQLRWEKGFVKYREDIEAFARKKYLLGQLEPDGSVLIKPSDL
jgi:transcriptional regulator with XRE-family HTH domain